MARAHTKKFGGVIMKTQMKFQKIMCLLMIILGALSAVYCFIYCSAGLGAIGGTLNQDGSTYEGVIGGQPVAMPEATIYQDVQPFNDLLLILSIVIILCGVLLYITATNKIRNYYISNYVAIGIVSIANIAISIYILIQNTVFYTRFLDIIADPTYYDRLFAIIGKKNIVCTAATWNFELGYVLYPIIILASLALIANLVWKVMLMRGEKKLLENSAVKEGA